jgi:hypothetical protein
MTAVEVGHVTDANRAPEQPAAVVTEFPLFAVSTHKLIVLSLCTFNLYALYWCYQNWKRLKRHEGDARIRPFWRAVFANLWGFALFTRVRHIATSNGVATDWSPALLAAFYFVFTALWRLPDPWWLLTYASVLFLIPVQQTARRVNDLYGRFTTEDRNERYTAKNIVAIAIGGPLFLLAIVGTFLDAPRSRTTPDRASANVELRRDAPSASTVVYIPVGPMGVPITGTFNTIPQVAEKHQ